MQDQLWLAVVAAAVVQMGCIADILGDSRRLPGGYYVECWDRERGHYTLGGPTHSADAGGVLKGRLELLGWNDDYIVAWRVPMVAGDGKGWMIVDIRTHAVRGPLTTEQLDTLRASDSSLDSVVIKPPEELWTR